VDVEASLLPSGGGTVDPDHRNLLHLLACVGQPIEREFSAAESWREAGLKEVEKGEGSVQWKGL
jgi:hypothetical protein